MCFLLIVVECAFYCLGKFFGHNDCDLDVMIMMGQCLRTFMSNGLVRYCLKSLSAVVGRSSLEVVSNAN